MNMSNASHAAQQETQLLNSLFGEEAHSTLQQGLHPPGSDHDEQGESLGSEDSLRSDDSGSVRSHMQQDDVARPLRTQRRPRAREEGSRQVRARNGPTIRRDRRGGCMSNNILQSAFGTTAALFEEDEEDDDLQDGALDHNNESEDDALSTSNPTELNEDVEEQIFNVPGVSCVGCTLDPARLAPINAFIESNAATKHSEALWRTAECLYRQTVVEPCRRERSNAPEWTWQEIQNHYLGHVVSSRLCRLQTLREMAAMRRVLVSQMIVANDESGSQEIDKGTLEQYLKVVSTESREHALLNSTEARNSNAANTASRYGSSIVPMNNNAAASDEI